MNCHFLNRFRTSDTSEPVCDSEVGFSQQHMCGTLKMFRYSWGNVRNSIFRLIQKEEANGDCEWQVSFLQPTIDHVHQGCARAVSVWGSDKRFCVLPLPSSIVLLFTYVRVPHAVHLRHHDKGSLVPAREPGWAAQGRRELSEVSQGEPGPGGQRTCKNPSCSKRWCKGGMEWLREGGDHVFGLEHA